MGKKRARKKARAIGVNTRNDDVVNRYRSAVQSRSEQRKPGVMPDLASAHKEYDPDKDGPMTLGQVGSSQQARDQAGTQESGGLSPQTVEGLRAIKRQTDMQREESEPRAEPEAPEEGEKQSSEKPVSDQRLQEAFDQMDDTELDLMMNRIRQDVIQNDKEREAVRKRVVPMSIEDGLVDMDYTQSVPIVPDKLTVVYRSVSSMEQFEMRKILRKELMEDPAAQSSAAEKLGLMQIVASVVQINGNRLPDHLTQNGPHRSFDADTFIEKLNRFLAYPQPLIHSLGTHGYWFDQRVRELFVAENLKNG